MALHSMMSSSDGPVRGAPPSAPQPQQPAFPAPPPAQYPPGQFPPAQYPPAQYPPAQYPPAQYPPAQYPPAQYPPAYGAPSQDGGDPRRPPRSSSRTGVLVAGAVAAVALLVGGGVMVLRGDDAPAALPAASTTVALSPTTVPSPAPTTAAAPSTPATLSLPADPVQSTPSSSAEGQPGTSAAEDAITFPFATGLPELALPAGLEFLPYGILDDAYVGAVQSGLPQGTGFSALLTGGVGGQSAGGEVARLWLGVATADEMAEEWLSAWCFDLSGTVQPAVPATSPGGVNGAACPGGRDDVFAVINENFGYIVYWTGDSSYTAASFFDALVQANP